MNNTDKNMIIAAAQTKPKRFDLQANLNTISG